MSSENDTPTRNHLKGAFDKLRMILIVSAVMAALTLAMIAINFSSLSIGFFIIMFITGLVALAGIVSCILTSQKVDAPFDSQSLVTVGGPYSKDRLTGLSKLTSDGYIISGDLYINSLFGANPTSVDVEISLEGSESFKALVKCTKAVPGYSVYKIRFKETTATPGSFVVKTTYRYSGKSIVLFSSFLMEIPEGGQEIKVKEGNVEAKLEFDEVFNSTEFDDALFNPSEE
jgi:hypothetical protein